MPRSGFLLVAVVLPSLLFSALAFSTAPLGPRSGRISPLAASFSRASSINAHGTSIGFSTSSRAGRAVQRGVRSVEMMALVDPRGGPGHDDEENMGTMESGWNSDEVGSIQVDPVGEVDAEGPENAKAQHFVVSEVVLLWLWLERRLAAEVRKENFKEAAAIKQEMQAVHAKALAMLEVKIQSAASKMRVENAKKRKDVWERIKMDLEQAVVEEDYQRAEKLRAEKEAEEQRQAQKESMLPFRLLKKVDNFWLEGELNNKIAAMRAREDQRMKDPVARLKHELVEALEEDDYEKAAKVSSELKEEEHKRDVERMERQLKRDRNYVRLEEERLKKDPVLYLEHRLNDQVQAEDFEEAQVTARELGAARAAKAVQDLTNRTALMKDMMARVGEVGRLKERIQDAVEAEDYELADALRAELIEKDEVTRAERDVDAAERAGDEEEAARLREGLGGLYAERLSMAMLKSIGKHPGSPKHRIGEVVVCGDKGYKGVVLGWTERCLAGDGWAERHGVDGLKEGRKQRFYHILPDVREVAITGGGHNAGSYSDVRKVEPAFLCGVSPSDRNPSAITTYVAEENITRWDYQSGLGSVGILRHMMRAMLPESPISHSRIAFFFFSYSRGRYLHSGTVRSTVFFHAPNAHRALGGGGR
uniref:Hemimethylated DNA-binding domain-containing protein n=2 Tax=Hemiselmis andersenii TaxID=464988 RepID=A0A6U2GBG8_HEMAN|mmetsp:Transcript_36218/g.84895  ORF Transcript_36218/g.84895 Transcript_36218/m.84895 type:complete len:648 (+) Transcript_36218:219-2162(+)